jgi:putative acetyltransferase
LITIRSEVASDYAAVREVHTLAFGRDNEARLVEAIRASPAFIPQLSLVAAEEGRVAGHILFSRIHIRSERINVPALALAPLAVLPSLQNRDIGSQLVRQGLEECRRLQHAIVIVLGHRNYYPRFGFSPAKAKGIEAPFPVSEGAFMVLELRAGSLNGVRGTVEYPPTFAGV